MIDFFMDWIAGLPFQLGKRCHPMRPILVVVALVWIPIIFILFLPLLAVWMLAAMVNELWKIMYNED